MLSMDIKSYYCCTSGSSPPSPINLAPRPVTSPKKIQSRSSKGKDIDLWSGKNANKGSEVLKAALVFSQVVRHIKPRRKTPLEILIEENARSDTDDSVKEVRIKKPYSAPKAVAGIIKEHLRKEPVLSRRLSRPSVGTSDEEIERRAELRRLRNQRIREELSQESEYDIDAKSIPSIIDGSGVSVLGLDLSRLTTPNFRYPALPDVEPRTPEESPKSQVRKRSKNSSPRTTSNPLAVHEVLGHSNSPRKWGNHFTDAAPGAAILSPRLIGQRRKFSPLPPTPLGPMLQPKRLPSISESHSSSWRLVFGTGDGNQNFSEQKRDRAGSYTLGSKGSRSASLVSRSEKDDLNFEKVDSNFQVSPRPASTRDLNETPVAANHLNKLGVARVASALRSSSSQSQIQRINQQESLSNNDLSAETCSRYAKTSGSFSLDFQGSLGTFFDDLPSFSHLMINNDIPFSPCGSLSDFFPVQEDTNSKAEESKTSGATLSSTNSKNLGGLDLSPTNSVLQKNGIYLDKITSEDLPPILDTESLNQARESALTSSSASFGPIIPRTGKFREEFNLKSGSIDTQTSFSHSAAKILARPDYDNKNEETKFGKISSMPISSSSGNKKAENERYPDLAEGAANRIRYFGGNLKVLGERSGNTSEKKTISKYGALKDAISKFSTLKKDANKINSEKPSFKDETRRQRFQEFEYIEPWKTENDDVLFETMAKNLDFFQVNHPSGTEKHFPSFSRLTSHENIKFTADAEKFGHRYAKDLGKLGVSDREDNGHLVRHFDEYQTRNKVKCDKKKYRPRVGKQIGRLTFKPRAQDKKFDQKNFRINGSPESFAGSNIPKFKSSLLFLSDSKSEKDYHNENEISEKFGRIGLIENSIEFSSQNSSVGDFLFSSDMSIGQKTKNRSYRTRKFNSWSGKEEEKNTFMKRNRSSSNSLPRRSGELTR